MSPMASLLISLYSAFLQKISNGAIDVVVCVCKLYAYVNALKYTSQVCGWYATYVLSAERMVQLYLLNCHFLYELYVAVKVFWVHIF